jgi:hypothetical protein
MAIEWRGVQEIDAKRKRAVSRADRGLVVELCVEIAERCGSKAQNRHLKPGASERTARNG